MNNKTLVYRPPKGHHRSGGIVSLKIKIKEFLIESLIFILSICVFVLSIAIAYNAYTFIKLQAQKNKLLQENQALKREYNKLTSREVLLKKAKILGLHPPGEKDIWKLKYK